MTDVSNEEAEAALQSLLNEPGVGALIVKNQVVRALTAAAQVRAGATRAHKTMTAEEYLALNLKGWHEVCWRYDGAGGVGVRYLTDGILPTEPDSGPSVLGIAKGEE